MTIVERLKRTRLKVRGTSAVTVLLNPDGPDAVALIQSQSARIAELEDLPRLIELQRTAAPDCDREEGWNAGLDRAADIARNSLTKDSTSG